MVKEYMEVICNIGRDKGAQMTVRKDIGEAGLCTGTYIPVEVETPVVEAAEVPKPVVATHSTAPKVPVAKGAKSKTMAKSKKKGSK